MGLNNFPRGAYDVDEIFVPEQAALVHICAMLKSVSKARSTCRAGRLLVIGRVRPAVQAALGRVRPAVQAAPLNCTSVILM